jgi:hypothetical protein
MKQALPGEPQRELTLIEVTYPPGTGSPAHLLCEWGRGLCENIAPMATQVISAPTPTITQP